MTTHSDNSTPGEQDKGADNDVRELLSRSGPRQTPNPAVSETAKQQIAVAWQRAVIAEKSRRKRQLTTRFAMAAVLALTVAGGLLSMNYRETAPLAKPVATLSTTVGEFEVRRTDARSDTADLFPGELVQTRNNAKLTLTLSDGTLVHLDEYTELTVQPEGHLWLHRGKLYVDAALDLQHVVVHTPWGLVTDVGTQFEMSLEDDALTIVMREGSVTIDLADATAPVTVIQAHAVNGEGDLVRIDNTYNVSRDTVSTTADRWDWLQDVSAPLPAGTHNLVDVLAWAGRTTGRNVQYGSPATEMSAKNTFITTDTMAVREIEPILAEIVADTTEFALEFGHNQSINVQLKR